MWFRPFLHFNKKWIWQWFKYTIASFEQWYNMKIWFLIQYEMIMMFIWFISHVSRINVITVGIIWHSTYITLSWQLYIFFCTILICWMLSHIEIHWNYNYHLSKNKNNLFKTNLFVIVRRIIPTHPTQHLFIWNIVNTREWNIQTA